MLWAVGVVVLVLVGHLWIIRRADKAADRSRLKRDTKLP